MKNKQAETTLAQDKSLTPSIEKALKKFFNGSVTIFEAGLEEDKPEHYQDRPGFQVIAEENKGKTIYFQPAEKEASAKVTVNKPENEAILDTENHKMFVRIEERFRNVHKDKDITVFIIDPDVIRARYAMDDNPNKNMGKTILMYLQDRMREVAPDTVKQLSGDDAQRVLDTSINDDSPHASPKIRNITDENIKGEGMVSVVTGVNPETLDTEWFSGIPGHKERMEKDGLTQEHFQRLALYHELGHATDTDLLIRNKKWHELSALDRTYSSQRTECIADAHAILQMARDDGNTKMGELWGDFRIDRFVSTVNKMDDLRTGAISPDFEKKIDALQKERLKPQKGETKDEAVLRKLEKNDALNSFISKYAPGLAYHTAPTIDAAVEFAKKGLADGSLQKMTDREVLAAGRKIVEEASCSKAQVASYLIAAATGKKNQVIETAKERNEQARNNMTLDRETIDKKHADNYAESVENRTKDIRKAVGLPEEKKDKKEAKKEMSSFLLKIEQELTQIKTVEKWKNDFTRHLSEKGGDKKALLKIIASEKDIARKADGNDFAAKMKLELMNVMLEKPEAAINLANAKKVVKTEIQKIETPKSEAKGVKAVGEFISLTIKTIEFAEHGLEKAEKRKDSTLTIDEQMKSLSSEKRDYKKLLKTERAAQAAAFKVRKNPAAWAIAKESTEISALITEKSKQRHPQWIDRHHLNLLENKPEVTDILKSAVSASKSDILTETKNSKTLLDALKLADAKTANKYLKEEKKKLPIASVIERKNSSR